MSKLLRLTSSLLVIVLVLVNVLWAAAPGSTLKKLRKRYKQIATIQTDFKEVFEWEMTGETNIREGSMIVAADNRFRIDTPEQLLVSNGTDIYRYNKIRNQIIIESVSNASQNAMPRRLLLDFADGFNAVELTPIAVNNSPGFRLDLVAEDPEKTMLKAAVIWATEADMTLYRLKLIDLSGNATTYSLSSIEFNRSIDASLTSFNPPEGAEVFDLR